MKGTDQTIIKSIFDYLYNPTETLERADGAIVFGSCDPLVAKSASKVWNQGLTSYLLFTGGTGRASGILTRLEMPEAKFQAALANTMYGVPEERIYVEPNASNGGECCRFSIDKIREHGLPHEGLTLIVHPTSLRRVQAVMEPEAVKKNFNATYQRVGTDYNFDSKNPIDQQEAIAELLRLADWPAKGWSSKQFDLPLDLVGYAREVVKQ